MPCNVVSDTELRDDLTDQEGFGDTFADRAIKVGTLKELHDLCLEIT